MEADETMKNPMRKKTEHAEKASRNESLSLTGALLNREAHVELQGTHEALLEGCKGIVEYREDLIRVNIRQGQLAVGGRNLELSCVSEDSMIVRGYINKIEFCQ